MVKDNLKNRTSYIVLLLLLIIGLPACTEDYDLLDALPEDRWDVITAGSQLAGNNLKDIMLDSQDRLWFATFGYGVSMFDGISWTTYNTSNSNILNDYITCIEEDADGDIWFGTYDGISILVDNSQWFYLQESYQLYIHDMKRMSNGWVWTGTEDRGYIVYDGSGFFYSTPYQTAELNNVNAIESDATGNIWLGTDLGALVWNGSVWDWKSSLDGLPGDEIWSLFTDSKGRMWIGSAGGEKMAYYDGYSFTDISLFNGQSSIYTADIMEDQNGNIWFGTWYDGVIRYNGVFMESFKEFNSVIDDDIEAISSDNKGNIWFGSYDQGLVKYSPAVKY